MDNFKSRWQITKNWQLLFPFLGIVILGYSAFRIAMAFTEDFHLVITLALSILIYFILLKLTLFIFKKLENKWVVLHRWEMIRIFIVFAVTGTSSMYVSRPVFKMLGITKESLNPIVYWILFIIIGLIFYQILLVFFGWLFGQFQFFWEFEKKMLRRFGFKRFLD